MLKTLKWAYDMGIRHERIRISAHLQNLSHDFGYFYQEGTERAKFDAAVNAKVKAIVDGILTPTEKTFSSIMFPNDGKSGDK